MTNAKWFFYVISRENNDEIFACFREIKSFVYNFGGKFFVSSSFQFGLQKAKKLDSCFHAFNKYSLKLRFAFRTGFVWLNLGGEINFAFVSRRQSFAKHNSRKHKQMNNF